MLRLGEGAYGAPIRQEIHERSGRDVSINAVYTTLDRLEQKGLLKSWDGEPTPERGGRHKKFYVLYVQLFDRTSVNGTLNWRTWDL